MLCKEPNAKPRPKQATPKLRMPTKVSTVSTRNHPSYTRNFWKTRFLCHRRVTVPPLRGPTAYRYGSTATIIAHFVEKENIFLLYGMSGRFGRSFFRKLKTYLLSIFICEIFVLEPFLLKISPFFPFFLPYFT